MPVARNTWEPGFGHSQADHLIGIDAVHRVFRQPARLADRRAEEGGLAVVADAGRGEISSRTVRASDAPAFRVESRKGISPPRAPRSVPDPLGSYDSRGWAR